MKAKSLLGVVVVLGLLLTAGTAQAASFNGQIRLVQVNSAGLRFLASGQALSFYATGDIKEVLLQAFYAKTTVSIGYTVTPCLGGILGTCGNVDVLTVDGNNLP
jgi:hypothetical protein